MSTQNAPPWYKNRKFLKFLGILSVLLMLTGNFFLSGCSMLKASPAQSTPFLTHGKELKPWYDHAPWDAVWSAHPGKIMVKSETVRSLYVAPINTKYLNITRDDKGHAVQGAQVSAEDTSAIVSLLKQNFTEAIQNEPNDSLRIVEKAAEALWVLEIALVELVPTKVWENAASDVAGLIIPGSNAVEEAAVISAQAAGGAFAAGSIAIELRISDRASGAPLAEAKDRESDPASVVPNYKDFEKFGWSRKTIKNWAKQFVEVLNSPPDKKVEGASNLSFVPW